MGIKRLRSLLVGQVKEQGRDSRRRDLSQFNSIPQCSDRIDRARVSLVDRKHNFPDWTRKRFLKRFLNS
jgi:hypothetical protein